MKKVLTRLLLFFIGIPVLIALILIPYASHLPLNLLIIATSAIGAWETSQLFKRKGFRIHPLLAVIAGASLPLAAYLELIGVLPGVLVPAMLSLGVIAIMSFVTIRTSPEAFSGILDRVGAAVLVLLYPGFLFSYAVRFSGFEHASLLIVLFMLSVYLNDAFAWVAGNLFGAGNRNVTAISPNKSVAGFIVGFLASPSVLTAGYFLFPRVFPGPLLGALVIGLLIGCTTIFGDLAESALKRSASTKDSGTIIPGRGGILDSADSIVFSAPVFFYLYQFFFTS